VIGLLRRRRRTAPDVIDIFGANVTASFLLNDHHDPVGELDSEGYLDNCERCWFTCGWVQRTSLGPDEWGHATAATSEEIRAWIETQR
jgi:hypothetical protein